MYGSKYMYIHTLIITYIHMYFSYRFKFYVFIHIDLFPAIRGNFNLCRTRKNRTTNATHTIHKIT